MIRTALSCLVVVNLMSAIFSDNGTAGEPHTFRSDAGRFSIDFPAPSPSTRTLTGDKFLFTDYNIRHTVEVGDAEFAVEIHDVPRAADALLPSRYILEKSKAGLLEDMEAREVNSRAIDREGHPGRAVAFEIPERSLTGNLLIVLAKNRLYLVTVLHPEQEDPPMSYTFFFESFEFWLE